MRSIVLVSAITAFVVACGDSTARRRDAALGAWRFELATAVADARDSYGRDSRTKEEAESRTKKLDVAAASNLSSFEISLERGGVASFRYLMKGEPTLPASWKFKDDSEFQIDIDRSQEHVSAPSMLLVYLRPDGRIWMLTPEMIGLPFRRAPPGPIK